MAMQSAGPHIWYFELCVGRKGNMSDLGSSGEEMEGTNIGTFLVGNERW